MWINYICISISDRIVLLSLIITVDITRLSYYRIESQVAHMVNYSSQSISLTSRFSVNIKDVKVKVVFRILLHLLLSDDFQAALHLKNRRHHLG